MDAEVREAVLDAMKELAYGASHEINNPLANIAARAQALVRDEPHPERRRSLEAIHQQAMRAHEMISDLMLYARPPEAELAPCDLVALVSGAADSLRSELADRRIELRVTPPDGEFAIRADAGQVAVVLRELLRNAVEAIGRGGRITVTLTREADEEASQWVVAEIVDNGSGLSERERQHLFDPFFSGREAGRGLGFGLSKAWRIVIAHGGEIAVENRSGAGDPVSGVVATVRLPAWVATP